MNGDADDAGDRVLGEDAGDEISLKKGRFGPYIQRGEATEEHPKPPRASLPKGWAAGEMDLEKALLLLSLPREIGPHPEDGEMIEAGIGRYGPFVKHGRLYANLKEAEDVFTIGMNRAVEELAKKAASRGGARGSAAKPLKEVGEHPSEGGPIHVMAGRYGPYVKFAKINATLPKDMEPESVTLEQALELIEAKVKKGGKKPAPKKKPSAKKKTPAKKKPAA
jgi:DNA topoisomerase-1